MPQRFVVFLLTILCLTPLAAAEKYYRVALAELPLVEGRWPATQPATQRYDMGKYVWRQAAAPYAAIDGGGEAYVSLSNMNPWQPYEATLGGTLYVKSDEPTDLTGHLYVPRPDDSGMDILRFKLPAASARAEYRQGFDNARRDYFLALWNRAIPGGAWFRAQADTMQATDAQLRPRMNNTAGNELEATYDLFSGNQALAENLQLERVLPPSTQAAQDTVAVESLGGITIKEMDWSKLNEGRHPALDPLAAAVPADQHALFFQSFAAMTNLLDEVRENGLAIYQGFAPSSQDSQLPQRYQKQLGLDLTQLGRLLGPQLIRSIAITGSDPYLRMGTDVAVVYQPVNSEALLAGLKTQIALQAQSDEHARLTEGKLAEVPFTLWKTPTRSVCSYLAQVGDNVVVTNSAAQLQRLIDAARKKTPTLDSLPEYLFFRDRYPLGQADDRGFLFVSDATIRRWCSPRWRIADSRRVRAAAVMMDVQARHLDEMIEEHTAPTPATAPANSAVGELHFTRRGIDSAVYNTLEFMTPIAELPMEKVSAREADAYRQWRDGYQRNWRWAFDPIGLRLASTGDSFTADLTIMPLIVVSEYRTLIDLTRDARLAPGAADPHETIAQLAMAINPKSPPFQGWGTLARGLVPGLRVDPLAWMGGWITIFADADAYWDKMLGAKDPQNYAEHNIWSLPVGLEIQVASGLKLAVFLTTAHAFIDQSAPNMTSWQTEEYHGRSYVKITPTAEAQRDMRDMNAENAAIYYAILPDSLLLTLNLDLLHRAIDRQVAATQPGAQPVANSQPAGAAPAGSPPAAATAGAKPTSRPAVQWLGESLAGRATPKLVDVLTALSGKDWQALSQNRAWDNLPILNQWRRRFPQMDPVKLHAQFWGVTLQDGGGGQYVWNDRYQTMESTVYGHPGQPKSGPAMALPLRQWQLGEFGLSFENDGLRAKVRATRGK